MNRSTGARLCATAVVGAMSLALLTGCSDSGSDDSKNTGSGGASENAKTYTKAELEKLIIAQGDVTGYKVEPVDKELSAEKGKLKGDEKCLPLAYVMSGLAPTDAPAETNTMATQDKKPSDTASKSLEDLTDGETEDALADAMSVDVSVVALSSYDGEGAADAFKTVSDAVKDCAGGFEITDGSDEPTKMTKVTEEKAVGATGDEAVAFSATGEMDAATGETATVHTQVVRHGNTIASYFTMNLGAMMSQKDYTVPAVVVNAQGAKLK
ncbi:hypothetical protein ACIQ6Y_27030 [Streptomyces sp. NPDC096205]|uniref:hypothetical protein n=1 Tax=Streptomyces sp. NPDC096205 TaxID=3366081 RepID=UPI003807FEBC